MTGARLVRLARGLVHPIVLVFFAAALVSRISGDDARAVYFVAVGLALTWDLARRRAGPVPRSETGAAVGANEADAARPPLPPLPPPVPLPASAFSPDSVGRRRAVIRRFFVFCVLASAGYAVVVGQFRPYSIPATISVTTLGAAAVFLAWRNSSGSAAPPVRLDPVGLAAWAVLALTAGAWELAALYMQPTLTTDSQAHPTLSYLATGLLRMWPGRSVFLFLWLAFGLYLARL